MPRTIIDINHIPDMTWDADVVGDGIKMYLLSLLLQHPRALPSAVIVLYALAGLIYLANRDYKHAIYNLSASILTWSVTY